jgi:hypothetical protein
MELMEVHLITSESSPSVAMHVSFSENNILPISDQQFFSQAF